MWAGGRVSLTQTTQAESGVDLQVSLKKEGAQVSLLSLQIPVEPTPWALEIPPAEVVASPSQRPRCPPGFSLLMSLQVPRKQCLKRGTWMDPIDTVWGGELAALASCLPRCPTAPWAVSPSASQVTLGCFLRDGSSPHQPGGET